jgi:uncharacterized protein (TIGR02300 family)
MAKIDLGTKRVCPGCAAKYYDLGRNPAKCPKCDFEFDPTEDLSRPVVKPRASKADAESDADVAADSTEKDDADDTEPATPETAEIVGQPSFPAGDGDGDGDDESPDVPSDESDGFGDSDEETAESTETDEDDNTKLLIDDDEDEGFGEINVTKDEDL